MNDLLKQMTLLYAEDEIVAQTFYSDFFQQYFKAVHVAVDGQQALDIYEDKKPDIVILDINMPVLSGLDVCRVIRKDDKETKIILLTSRTDKTALFEAIELGLTTYLEKPVSKEKLNETLLKLSKELYQSNHISLWEIDSHHYFWDNHKKELFCDSDIIILSKKEKLLLELLITTIHDKVSYEQVYNAVWPEDIHGEKYSELSIKTLIKKLRAKLPPKVIKNSYGLGYYLVK